MSEKKFSTVIPVYNEEESLDSLFLELTNALDGIGEPYEMIFVDDCSSDRTAEILEKYRQKDPEKVKVINLSNRSGQTFAMRTGLDAVQGQFAVTLDADLQNDPADIPRLLAKMKEGNYDMVCGWRKARKDTPLKAVLSKTGNVLQRVFTGMSIHDISCTLRLFKRECASKIALNWEGQHRFIPLSLSLQGYNVGEIVSNHRDRKFGYSKYSHKRIFRVVYDFFKILITKGKK